VHEAQVSVLQHFLMEGAANYGAAGRADLAPEALAAATRLAPDVVLMDVSMPGTSGLEATRSIRAGSPATRVLILTIHDREDYLYEALRAGASGYVLKGADVQELLRAVRSAARGEMYLYPGATRTLIEDYVRSVRGGPDRDPYDGLTEREREVLRLIAQGQTTAEIAKQLVLSPHTVQSHRDHVMAKLDLHSKAALIKYAIARGLIEL